jgi:hypothetical protein
VAESVASGIGHAACVCVHMILCVCVRGILRTQHTAIEDDVRCDTSWTTANTTTLQHIIVNTTTTTLHTITTNY